MHIKSAEFVKSAVKPSHYPEAALPEVAFAGRSNVGKSSLINALLNRKKLVKTSSTPGRTQLINFFDINKSFTFVDLPGYGYAKVPKRVVKEWGAMIETYLSERKTLAGAVLLMDIRRTPGDDEIDLINWFHYYSIPLILVLTKADKFSRQKQTKHIKKYSEALDLPVADLIPFSAKSKQGKDKLWEKIEELISDET